MTGAKLAVSRGRAPCAVRAAVPAHKGFFFWGKKFERLIVRLWIAAQGLKAAVKIIDENTTPNTLFRARDQSRHALRRHE